MVHYDFHIKNGRVFSGTDWMRESAGLFIKNGKICPPPTGTFDAAETLDACGCIIAPGLIDFHTHLHSASAEFGVHPDVHMLPNGVTTVVDAGTNGTSNLENAIRTTQCWVNTFFLLHISATGIVTEVHCENLDPATFDEEAMDALFSRYPQAIVGLKVRVGRKLSQKFDFSPVERAVQLANRFQTRVYVHATDLQKPYADLFSILRRGDVVCHCFHGLGDYTLRENGRIIEAAYRAREKGILFDSAGSRINHSNAIIRQAIRETFYPDIISSDIIMQSVYRRPAFSLPYMMSEFLEMGMPLEKVLAATTSMPASLLNANIGRLAPGMRADLAAFRIKEQPISMCDRYGDHMQGRRLLFPEFTIKDGRLAYRNPQCLYSI